MKKIKLTKSQILIHCGIIIIFLLLTNARGYSVSPFTFGILFALMWVGVSMPLITGEYMLTNLLLMNKLADLYSTMTTVFILIVVYCVHKRIKKPMNVVLVGVYALISQLVSLYYIYNLGGWLDVLIFAILGMIFLYVCITVFQVIVLRGGICRLTLDESICVFALIVAMSLGVAEIYVFDCAIYKFVGGLAILACVGINKKQFSIIVGIAIGLGVAIVTSSLMCVGEMAIIAIMANIFNPPHKFKIGISMFIGEIAMQLYFVGVGLDIVYALIPTAFAIICFLLIPNRLFERVGDYYQSVNAELSVRNVVGSVRKNIKHRMSELSDVFAQMKQIHLKLMKQDLEKSQVISILTGELAKSLCNECRNKNNCYKGLGGENTPCINKLVDIALKKGKITILDLPSSMVQKCGIVNLLIGKINQLVAQYENYESMIKDVNNVKFLLAEQMGAVSQLLLDLGQELDQNIAFDSTMQGKIVNGLLAQNIVCSEVLIFSEKAKDVSVVAIVKGDNAYNPLIEKVVSKMMGVSMVIVNVEPTDLNDYYSVNLQRACERDIVFGITTRNKTGSVSSGDSHSLIRLGNNKYMLALCDGMGSGENARKMSALTMGLVENFYKAGFEDEFILNNINKLLTINNQENFSTLDLCIIDLSKEIIDFIKLGATYGLIKREQEVEKVDTGTLPLGILGKVKPSVSHFAVTSKDMVIMVTDGITDAYQSYEELAEFVNAVVSTNPQVVAQTIMDDAVARYGGIAKDDMTVLVARTFLSGGKVNK